MERPQPKRRGVGRLAWTPDPPAGDGAFEALFSPLCLLGDMLPRERLLEIGAAVGSVAVMYALLYYIGRTYTVAADGQRELTATGGEVAVVALVGFVLLMTAAGLFLLRSVTAPEAESEAGSDGPADGSADG